MATPFHCPCPWCTVSYPSALNASWGNVWSESFVSWRQSTSGFAYASHSSTRSWRAFSELTFQVAIRTPGRYLRFWDAMVLPELHQRVTVDLVGGGDRDPHVGARLEAGGAHASFEDGAFAEDHARSDLGDTFAVDGDREHTVEQQEHGIARITLVNQVLALLQRPDLRPFAGRHDRDGELAFQRGLDRGD